MPPAFHPDRRRNESKRFWSAPNMPAVRRNPLSFLLCTVDSIDAEQIWRQNRRTSAREAYNRTSRADFGDKKLELKQFRRRLRPPADCFTRTLKFSFQLCNPKNIIPVFGLPQICRRQGGSGYDFPIYPVLPSCVPPPE